MFRDFVDSVDVKDLIRSWPHQPNGKEHATYSSIRRTGKCAQHRRNRDGEK